MTLSPRSLLIFLALLHTSCEQKKSTSTTPSPQEGGGFQAFLGTTPKDEDFTPWMSRAELQYAHENSPAGTCFSFVQGRDNNGFRQYRAVRAPFLSTEWDLWAVYWGLSEQEMFEAEIKLLRNGFIRSQLQVFTDSGGAAVHQGVWLRARGHRPVQDVATVDTSVPNTHVSGQTNEPQTQGAEDPGRPPLPEDPPEVAVTAPPRPVPVAPPPVLESADRQIIHTVKKNETTSSVAKRYKVQPEAIIRENNLKSTMLRIGQRLKITVKGPRPADVNQ